MEPALKQRLIGAAVLVALAVIFLPMLIKGPAPESGVSDVPLDLPAAPQGGYETRELPLVSPGAANGAGVVGLEGERGDVLPTVDTTRPGTSGNDNDNGGMMPPATAGGGYAVSFGSYASTADADRVVGALRASQLPGYQEAVTSSGRTLHRVRIGPFDSQATAEAARLRAAHVRDDVGSKVVALDASAGTSTASTTSAPVSTPTPAPSAAPVKTAPLPESPPVPKPASAPVVDAKPAPTAPATAQPEPAAADVGFAIQLGAFSNDADAIKLRDRARAMGFSAFVEKVQTDKGTLSRVRVGPVASRADAERLKVQVAEKMGISGFIQSHP